MANNSGTINTEERAPLIFKPTSKSKKPVAIDGEVTVTVVSGDATFVPNGQGNPLQPGWLVSSENPGRTVFLLAADGRAGPEVVDISETFELNVITPDAADLNAGIGAPEPKPET